MTTLHLKSTPKHLPRTLIALLCVGQLLASPIAAVAQNTPGSTVEITDVVDGAKLTIVKDANPDSAQDFEYYGPYGLNLFLDDANPDDGDGVSNSFSIIVPPGTYNFSEVGMADWDLTAIHCTPSDKAVVDLSINSAQFNVSAGDDVTCVYENTLSPNVTLTATPVNPTSTPISTAPATETPTETSVPPTDCRPTD